MDNFVGIDWGTSSFRAWHMNSSGAVLAEERAPLGMSKLKREDYAPLLEKTLATLGVGAEVPVLICGMAGAKDGWVEAGYLEVPCRPRALLAGRSVKVPGRRDVRILPGLCQRGSHPDVMRGEETILVGVDGDGYFQIPGTHSKFVSVYGNVIEWFSTAMTGELFALLKASPTLTQLLKPAEFSPTCFEDGVRNGASLKTSPLVSRLFEIRSYALLGKKRDGASYCSGLLIGNELGRWRHGIRTLVADGELAQRYEHAMNTLGHSCRTQSAELCAQRGLLRLAREIWT